MLTQEQVDRYISDSEKMSTELVKLRIRSNETITSGDVEELYKSALYSFSSTVFGKPLQFRNTGRSIEFRIGLGGWLSSFTDATVVNLKTDNQKTMDRFNQRAEIVRRLTYILLERLEREG